MGRWLFGLAVAAVAVSGCAQGGSLPASGVDPAGPSAQFDKSTGAIEGLVTDDELRPVAGAIILLDGQLDASTDERGVFRFSFVAPGPHALAIGAEGFRTAEVGALVREGEAARITIILEPLGSTQPYPATFSANGIIACSFAFNTPATGPQRSALCGLLQLFGVNGVDEFLVSFNAAPMQETVAGILLETEWRPTQLLSDRLMVQLYALDKPRTTETGGPMIGQKHGTTPVRQAYDRSQVDAAKSASVNGCGDHVCFMITTHYAEADHAATVDVTAVTQQRYTDWLTLFHVDNLGLEFSALADA